MRHHETTRKFGRVSRQRTALLRSLARSLIHHERIETTEAKAKELRPFVETLVTKGKIDNLTTKRLILNRLGGAEASLQETKKLLEVISPRFSDRNGGYTRITKIGFDKAGRSKAFIEFLAE